jgi:hypothetical protein
MKAPGSTTNPGLFIHHRNVFRRQGRVEAFTLVIDGIVPTIETQSPGERAVHRGGLDYDQRTVIERAICTTPLSL